ncbi:MAG: permease-like cell division protein FtsX [Chitinophagales bacterium]
MSENKLAKRRPKKSSANHIYSIISVTLILFFIGSIVVGAYFTKNQITKLREDIEFELELKSSLSEGDKVALRKKLSEIHYIRAYEYISKEEAVEWHQAKLGDNYMEQLGENPLYDAFYIKLKSGYVQPDSIQKIKTALYNFPEIKNISYSEVAVDFVSSNLKTVTAILGVICLIFLLIAITLIDNTIRLSMYSQRFLIRSMQLIGATRFFILKPFLSKSIVNGIVSAVLAFAMIFAGILYVKKQYDFHLIAEDLFIFAIPTLLIGLIVVGIILSAFSTWVAVRKYLRMKLDELY